MRKTKTDSIEAPKLDFDKTVEEISSFIAKIVKEAKAEGVVVGLSGGVDSSLVAALCVHALDKKKVLGVLMPTSFTPTQDIDDAKELAKQLGIRTEFIKIQKISESFFRELHANQKEPRQKIPLANILARIRMIILYYYGNLNNYLVAGTGDRSEDLIGFFTKYGDGGVDFLPTCHLYKTQVRELAMQLGVPAKISYKPSSPQLYPGHKATDEIPIVYEKLDPILVGLFDHKLTPEVVSKKTRISIEVVNEVLRRFNVSKHKRSYPPMIREW